MQRTKQILIFLLLFVISLFVANCHKENPQLKLYDVEIYSMPVDEEGTTQEVFVSIKGEGFSVVKEEGNYKFHIVLDVDLFTPDNRTIQGIAKLDSVFIQKEKFDKYVNLELSFVLDETYPTGKYQVTIRGKDLIGNQSAEIKQEFVLD